MNLLTVTTMHTGWHTPLCERGVLSAVQAKIQIKVMTLVYCGTPASVHSNTLADRLVCVRLVSRCSDLLCFLAHVFCAAPVRQVSRPLGPICTVRPDSTLYICGSSAVFRARGQAGPNRALLSSVSRWGSWPASVLGVIIRWVHRTSAREFFVSAGGASAARGHQTTSERFEGGTERDLDHRIALPTRWTQCYSTRKCKRPPGKKREMWTSCLA